MDRAKIDINRRDHEDKPLKGLRDKGLVNFECADCGKQLLVVRLTDMDNNDKSEIMTRIVVRCGLCSGSSYTQEVRGQFYPGAPSDDMLFDVIDDNRTPEADVIFEANSK